MNRLTFLVAIFTCLFITTSVAQEYGSAFRVGLNFPRFIGPSETTSGGSNVEEFSSFTGFHVAGGVVFKLLDNYGFKAEVMFSQNGSRYRYRGDSYQVFNPPFSTNPVRSTGTRSISLRVTNSYIELPVTGYAKLGKLEFQLGASVGFLVSSTGTGTLRYRGTSDRDSDPISEYVINLDYNYLKDDLITTESLGEKELLDPFMADGQTITLPATMDAYDEFSTKDGKFYNTVDVAAIAGLSYYISRGLFVGASIHYGLLDVSNNSFDFSRIESNGLDPVSRSDKDNNFAIRASIGFSF